MNSIEKTDIDLKMLIEIFWIKKLFISLFTLFFAVLSIFVALQIPNKYTSSALLMQSSSESSGLGMLGQFSGMASLAGISLPGETNDRSIEAIEKIKSFDFFDNNFLPYIKLENLLAIKKYDAKTKQIQYDPALFNVEKNIWVREVSFPKKTIPSSQEAYKTYKTIINISKDNKTSFVNLTVKHHSPRIAKKWADLIISEINSSMRNVDKLQATKSVEFLNKQLPSVTYEEVRKSISKLQAEQLKSLMLIESNEDYIFQVLDSPVEAELKSSPNRPLICFLITLFGFILSLFYTILQHLKRYA